jgi:hypothetical protein
VYAVQGTAPESLTGIKMSYLSSLAKRR